MTAPSHGATAGHAAPGKCAASHSATASARWDVKVSPYLYISPFFILFAIVGLFPLVYTGYVSLLKFDPILHTGTFVGLRQLRLGAPASASSGSRCSNTITIFLLSAVPQIIIALAIAAVLDSNLKAQDLLADGRAASVHRHAGRRGPDLQQAVQRQLRPGQPRARPRRHPPDPAGTPTRFPAQIAIATMVNFRWTGYNALILLAGMQAIPRDLYEQASIDGAGRFRRFFSITDPAAAADPHLRHHHRHHRRAADLRRAAAVRRSTVVAGGADQQWLTLTVYLHNVGWFQDGSFGRAAAVAWLLFLLIVLDRPDQPRDHPKHRQQREQEAAMSAPILTPAAVSGLEPIDAEAPSPRGAPTSSSRPGSSATAC